MLDDDFFPVRIRLSCSFFETLSYFMELLSCLHWMSSETNQSLYSSANTNNSRRQTHCDRLARPVCMMRKMMNDDDATSTCFPNM